MYCTACGIDAERPWCPYCGEDMVEYEEAQLALVELDKFTEAPPKRRRSKRGSNGRE